MNGDKILAGRVALVTGASRGIGAETAKTLAAQGAHIVLMARTQGGLEEIDDAIRAAGGAATLMPQDIRDFEKIDMLGPLLQQRFGRLDIFIGNAGVLGTLGPLAHTKAGEWQKVMDVNLNANFRLIRTLDPLLRASDAGRVVLTTSGLAQNVMAYWGAYSASKAGLNMLGKMYAAETVKTPLRVNLLDPGVIDTALLREAFPGGFPGRTGDVAAVARAFADLCAPSCTRHGEIVKV